MEERNPHGATAERTQFRRRPHRVRLGPEEQRRSTSPLLFFCFATCRRHKEIKAVKRNRLNSLRADGKQDMKRLTQKCAISGMDFQSNERSQCRSMLPCSSAYHALWPLLESTRRPIRRGSWMSRGQSRPPYNAVT